MFSYEGQSQKLFDDVVNHLRKQGCRCVDKFEKCLYRGPDGLKCAIGGILPDELYSHDLENVSVSQLFCDDDIKLKFKSIADFIGKDNRDLSQELQTIHDRRGNEFNWESEFKQIAQNYNLKYTPPEVVS